MGKKNTQAPWSLKLEVSLKVSYSHPNFWKTKKKHQKGDDVWGILEGSQLILKGLDI